MNRLSVLFEKKPSGVLNIYCTAGYPLPESTLEVIKSLHEHGADIIELGIPYSDPLADGQVIQMSNTKAIQNGMTITKLFEQLKDFRKSPAIGNHFPVILMGYLNPVLQYGLEKFCSDPKSVGVDGLILPDLP